METGAQEPNNKELAVGRFVGRVLGRGPEGGDDIRVGHPVCPAEPQPRARAIRAAFKITEKVPPASPHLWGEAGWELVAETRRSKWGLLVPSLWQPSFGTNICSAVLRERGSWQAQWGQTLPPLAEAI